MSKPQKTPRRILLVGGGSGGHVTPLKAIAEALEQTNTPSELAVITDRRFFKQTSSIFADMPNTRLRKIYSGKFRRYSSRSLLWHLTHLPTLLKNLGDSFLIGIGTWQAWIWLIRFKPQVIFCKGGFVSVPVGLAARLRGIPLIIHDSDTHPGLTNRLLAPQAKLIATGMPSQYYNYEKAKMIYTGIPVARVFQPVSESQQAGYKQQLGFDPKKQLLLTTGGGTGAELLNQLVVKNAAELIANGWQIVQLTGAGKAADSMAAREQLFTNQQAAWQIHEFVDTAPYILAADLIVSRTGASAMQEFANAGKPVITMPSRHLTGGHQLKNAQMFAEAKAALVLDETQAEKDPKLLQKTIAKLFEDKTKLSRLAWALRTNFAKPAAAEQLARLILEYAGQQ